MILQSILRQNSQKLRSVHNSGWHSFKRKPQLYLNQGHILKTASHANRQQSDSELQALALGNVRARIRAETPQKYLIPRTKPIQSSAYIRAWIDSKRRPTEIHFSNETYSYSKDYDESETKSIDPCLQASQGIQEIKHILSSLFANAAEAMIAFNTSGDDFLTLNDLIHGLRCVGVHQLSIARALGELKFSMKGGRISVLHFMRLFEWGTPISDEAELELWMNEKVRSEVIHSNFMNIQQSISAKQVIMSNHRRVLEVLRQNIEPLKSLIEKIRSDDKAESPEVALKRQVINLKIGLSYEELETALAILSELSIGDLNLDDVETVLKDSDIERRIREKYCFYGSTHKSSAIIKDTIQVFPEDIRKSQLRVSRPQSSRAVSSDRLSIAQRPKTARIYRDDKTESEFKRK